MLKKILLSTLTAATLIVPTTGAFAADGVTVLNPNSKSGNTPPVLIESPTNNGSIGSGGITTMSTTWRVKTTTNLRVSASPTGAYVATLYAGDLVNGGSTSGGTWVYVTSSRLGVSGYVQRSAVEEYG